MNKLVLSYFVCSIFKGVRRFDSRLCFCLQVICEEAPHVAALLERANLSLSAIFRVSENQTPTILMNNLRSGTLHCPCQYPFPELDKFSVGSAVSKE